ncbi:unnamed protein product, partial [Didymodactylos carnosus]
MTGTRYNITESGWIDESILFDWLDRLFIPHVAQITKPILVILEGHYSHLSSRMAKLAKANQIHLLCLPPHATTALQPLDVAVFHYLRLEWRFALRQFYANNNRRMENADFPLILQTAYHKALAPRYCANGFSKAGLFQL